MSEALEHTRQGQERTLSQSPSLVLAEARKQFRQSHNNSGQVSQAQTQAEQAQGRTLSHSPGLILAEACERFR